MSSVRVISSASVIFIALFITCFNAGRWKGQIDWPDIDRAHLPCSADYPDDGAVILLDEGRNEIVRGDEIAFSQMERHRIIQIFDERGYAQANVMIPYRSATDISDIRGRTITADGRIVPLDTDKIYDVNLFPGFIFYSDIRAKRFTLPGIEKNCIIEYRWQAAVRNFTYWDQWTFQHEIPVRLSRYQLHAPAEWEIKYKIKGVDLQPEIVKAPAGFKQSYEWEARDIAPWRFEPGMPPVSEVAAALLFAPVGVKNWQDIAQWYHELIKDRLHPDAAIEKKTGALIHLCTNDYDRLHTIYEFVRDQIRYVAISIGIGGYQPHEVRRIFHDRYGDCKDKAALLIAMASCAGITVEPVMISTWHNGLIDTTIATYTQFNHLITRAVLPDGRTVWMDATEPFAPFGELPWYDAGLPVFSIDNKGRGTWRQTPELEEAKNAVQRIWRWHVNADGVCRGKLNLRFVGAPALETRGEIWKLTQQELRNYLTRQLLARFPAVKIDRIRPLSMMDLTQPLSFHASFTLPSNTGLLRCSLAQLSDFDWHVLFPDSARQYPLRFKYPYGVMDSLYIDLAPECKFLSLPAAYSISTSVLEYRLTCDLGAHDAMIKRELYLKRHALSADEFAEFRRTVLRLADKETSSGLVIQSGRDTFRQE
ncbi:DUF3857 and transglutaminase domain-containing protein [candidate division KSB1 bacterium]|nr:DUF3857 and transglutaminase domain-containing protein [candidate division KSB1 bacterium]